MSKTVNILFVVMILVMIFCNIYDTFVFEKKIWNDHMKEKPVRVVEEHKGEMTYLVFINPDGGVTSHNYSLDSLDFDMHKKFDK